MVLGWTASAVRAQPVFPALTGETTGGSTITLPLNEASGYTIVALAYGKRAEPLLEEWYAPAFARFVARSGLFAGDYQVELYLVPLFTGTNRAAYGTTMNKLRKQVDPDIARRVLFVKEDTRGIIDHLGLSDPDIPYFFVLDREGHIVQRVQGAYSVERLEELEAPLLN